MGLNGLKNPETMISRQGYSESTNLPLKIIKRIVQTVLFKGTPKLIH